jgi:hypothetical protein
MLLLRALRQLPQTLYPSPTTEDDGRTTATKLDKGRGDTKHSTDGARRYVARARFPTTSGQTGVAGVSSSVVDMVDHYDGLAGVQ